MVGMHKSRASMKSGRMKRNFWLNAEVDCMLRIFKEISLMQNGMTTTHYTFVQIANNMKKRGFHNKTADQIKRKWFQMKSAYLCYKRGNIDRLLLIPERFRPVIADFVESENKNTTCSEDLTNGQPNSEKLEKLPSDDIEFKLIKTTQQQILEEYHNMQKCLLEEELKYQYIRDKNWCKLFSLSNHND